MASTSAAENNGTMATQEVDPLSQETVLEVDTTIDQGVVASEADTQVVESSVLEPDSVNHSVVIDTSQHQTQIPEGTIIGTVQQAEDGSLIVPSTGQPVTIVSTGAEVGADGAVTITMVQAMDESGQLHHVQHHEVEVEQPVEAVEQKVKIMSVTSGQTAAEQIAAALAEAVAGTDQEGQIVATMDGEGNEIMMEDESSIVSGEMEMIQEPWNEEGCLVCNKDIKFDDPAQLSKPVNSKLKEFFLEYLAVGDNVQLENENVFPFCESCAADIEKLMNINRRIENMHKEFNRLRDEVAKKAVKTYITRSKPDWLEEDVRTEAYGNYFPEGEKPKTHKDQLLEVWKNRYDLMQPGPKGPMMIRSMDSRGRVTVVRLNSHGQPIPDRPLASTDSNLSRVARVVINGDDDDDSAGMEVYKCKECPKTFNVKAMLDYHMKIHANANKPYKCNDCGKGFAQRGGLVTHSLVHTGAKPYVCQVCHKAFRQKYHLTQHNLIHSGVKPFSCEICHKSFNVKMNLREHMRRHTGDRPYKCPFCTIIGFFRKKMLKEHIIKSHPEEEMPEELLGAETSYLVTGDLPDGDLEMETDGQHQDYSHGMLEGVSEGGMTLENSIVPE